MSQVLVTNQPSDVGYVKQSTGSPCTTLSDTAHVPSTITSRTVSLYDYV